MDSLMTTLVQPMQHNWIKTALKRSTDVAMVLSGTLMLSVGYAIPSGAIGSSETVDTSLAPSSSQPSNSQLHTPQPNNVPSLSAVSIPENPVKASGFDRPSAFSSATRTAIAPPPITPPSFSQTQIDYFLDIAMGSEYGNASPHIRKWATDLRIDIHGTPSSQDLASLDTVVDELNMLIDPIEIEVLDRPAPTDTVSPHMVSTLSLGRLDAEPEPANVNIYFVPHTDFSRYVPQYEEGNLGYAWIWWQDDTIYDATILISTNGINQVERSHLIREELTQSLGLLRDSYQYEDSIFFQLWTSTTQYSSLDEALIRMLYSPKIQPGMTRQAVLAAFADEARHASHSPMNATVLD